MGQVVGDRVAQGQIENRDKNGSEYRAYKHPDVYHVIRICRLFTAEGHVFVVRKRIYIFRTAEISRRQIEAEGEIEHKELGQHDQHAQPDKHCNQQINRYADTVLEKKAVPVLFHPRLPPKSGFIG